METNLFKTRYFIFAGILLGIFTSASSQDNKMSRQEKNEMKKSEEMASFAELDSLLNAKQFVLEADFLLNKYGEKFFVLSSLNFIKVNNDHGVLQTGTATGYGYNGVGGTTAEGKIQNWKISKNFKKMTFFVQFNIQTEIGSFDINMRVTSGNFASATISGLTPGNLTWEGHLLSPENSKVYKGQNSY